MEISEIVIHKVRIPFYAMMITNTTYVNRLVATKMIAAKHNKLRLLFLSTSI